MILIQKTNKAFKLTYKHPRESINREVILTSIPKTHGDSLIVSYLNKIAIKSRKKLEGLGTSWTEEEANKIHGILKTEFDKIITALGRPTSDWKLLNIDFNATSSKFKLTYKHSDELNINIKEIDLTTTIAPDDSSN